MTFLYFLDFFKRLFAKNRIFSMEFGSNFKNLRPKATELAEVRQKSYLVVLRIFFVFLQSIVCIFFLYYALT